MKSWVRYAFNKFGLDVVRLDRSPKYNLLGLRHRPFRTIVDIGANEGQFSKEVKRIFPDARIFCFEPLPEPFRKLREWVDTVEAERVKIFNLALGSSAANMEMYCHLDHDPSSSILKTTKYTSEIYPFTDRQTKAAIVVETLDHMFENADNELVPDILIKMDVQGYEDQVIRGGQETIKKAKACILEISLDHLYEGQAEFKRLLVMLEDLGFQYAGNLDQIYAWDGHVIYIDALFVKRKYAAVDKE